MGKNNRLIEQMKALARQHRNENVSSAIRDITPQFYASMALALHRVYGFGAIRIARVLEETKEIWEEFEGRGKELTNACYEETGIRIVNDESEIPEDER